MTILWHPNATRKTYTFRKGKAWKGGSGKPKFLFHTTETAGLPNYSAPPHMTLHPGHKLWQHIPFDRAAYSVRSGKVDSSRFVYQIEVIGRAREVPMYKDDPWYLEVADLIDWFHDNLGVPIVFEDFRRMRYGQFAQQRRNYATVDEFSGILGHAHVGRGIDSHWDPGRLDVPRLEAMLASAPPPPPPPKEEDMFLPLEFGDGYVDGTVLSHPDYNKGKSFVAEREFKKSDVRAVQEMLRDAGGALGLDGRYGPTTVSAMVAVLPSAADSKGTVFHGNDWTPLLRKVIAATTGGGGDLSRGDTVTLN